MPAMAVEFGPGGRRGGGCAGGAPDRARRSAVLRHGRHHRQGEPDPRRPVRDDARVRGRRRRLEPQPLDARHRPSDPRAGHRPGRGVGRRRLDRLGGPGRLAARRPEERRRRSRARLLRARRHRADRHRLQPAARLSRQGLAARRRPAHRSCGGGGGHRQAPGRAAGRRCAHGGRGRHRRRQPRHGRGAEDRLRAARPRSARVRAGGLRRGGAAACRGAGSRARHRRDRLPADPRRVLGARASSAPTSSATTCAPSTPPPRAPTPRALEAVFAALETRGRRHARPGRRRAGAAALRALRRCALRAPVLRAVHPRSAARARCRRRWRRSPRPSTIATASPTATTTAASRCSSSARASPPSAPFRRCSSATGRRRRAPTPSRAGARCGSGRRAPSRPAVYDRRRMPAGLVAPGPAIIESLESTILVPPDWQASDERRRLRGARRAAPSPRLRGEGRGEGQRQTRAWRLSPS